MSEAPLHWIKSRVSVSLVGVGARRNPATCGINHEARKRRFGRTVENAWHALCSGRPASTPGPHLVQGYLAHKKQPLFLGLPHGPTHCPTVGSCKGGVSYERGTPVWDQIASFRSLDLRRNPVTRDTNREAWQRPVAPTLRVAGCSVLGKR